MVIATLFFSLLYLHGLLSPLGLASKTGNPLLVTAAYIVVEIIVIAYYSIKNKKMEK